MGSILQSLVIPADFGKYDTADADTIRRLDAWKRDVCLPALAALQAHVRPPDQRAEPLSVAETTDVVAAAAPFDGAGEWVSTEARGLAQGSSRFSACLPSAERAWCRHSARPAAPKRRAHRTRTRAARKAALPREPTPTPQRRERTCTPACGRWAARRAGLLRGTNMEVAPRRRCRAIMVRPPLPGRYCHPPRSPTFDVAASAG